MRKKGKEAKVGEVCIQAGSRNPKKQIECEVKDEDFCPQGRRLLTEDSSFVVKI